MIDLETTTSWGGDGTLRAYEPPADAVFPLEKSWAAAALCPAHPAGDALDSNAIMRTLESLDDVRTKDELIAWARADLQLVLPHGGFVGCVGRALAQGSSPIARVTANRVDAGPDQSHVCYDVSHKLALKRWLGGDSAQRCWGSLEPICFDDGLNIAAHGMFDIAQDYLCFFSFHQLAAAPAASRRRLLRLLVPGMSAALLRCLRAGGKPVPAAQSMRCALTPREREVLQWICIGKTNGEIACILSTARNTVKNQTQSILIKMGVSTRAQAAAQAMQRPWIFDF